MLIMGFSDAVTHMNEAQMDAMGENVTYTPSAAGINPFEAQAIVGQSYRDEFETNNVSLRRDCRILHSDLVAHGLSEPVEQVRGASSDTITIAGPSANPETWIVAGKRYEYGMWVLALSDNTRVRG